MNEKELKLIIDKHGKWLRNEPGGERASLDWASLDWASLNGASLNGASLNGASLDWASLNGASLNRAKGWTLSGMLRIGWGCVSASLTLELMRWDVALAPNPKAKEKAMTAWATKGGPCPFSGQDARTFYFQEKRELWKPGKPKLTLQKLLKALLKEKNIKHDFDL